MDLQYYSNWLKAKELSEQTIERYCYFYLRFGNFKFNQENVMRFLSEKRNRNPEARAMLSHLRDCLLRNRKELNLYEDYLKDIADVYIPKVTGRKPIVIKDPCSREDFEKIVKALPTEEFKLMALISYDSGVRISELFGIKLNDFNWSEWEKDMNGLGEIKITGKGNQDRIAYITPTLMKRIIEFIKVNNEKGMYKAVDSKLFILGQSSYRKALKKAGLETGITKVGESGELIKNTRIFPHKFRYSYGYDLLEKKGVDIRYVQEALGHKQISTTQRYTKVTSEELKKKLKKAKDLEEVKQELKV